MVGEKEGGPTCFCINWRLLIGKRETALALDFHADWESVQRGSTSAGLECQFGGFG